MTQKHAHRLAAQPASATLAKLRHLYSLQPQLQYDKFGRRTALPSEIASQLKQQKSAAGASQYAAARIDNTAGSG